jgi:hypothetical protein
LNRTDCQNSRNTRQRRTYEEPLWSRPTRTQLIAILPVFVCYLVPLLKIGNIVYVYDFCTVLAIAILRWPRASHPWLQRFDRAWWLLAIAIMVGSFSALLRVGPTFRILAYTVQFMLALVYCRAVLLNCLTGKLEPGRFAGGAVVAALVAATLGILQFVLLQVNPDLADSLYRRYLESAGFDQTIYEKIHLRAWEATGNLRVVGMWYIATTFGGMMALGGAWLLLSRWKVSLTVIAFSVTYVCILLTLSRHAWVIGAMVLGLLFLKTRQATHRVGLLAFGVAAVTGLVVLLSNADSDLGMSTKDVWTQLNERLERTTEAGFEDSSLLTRYVAGTLRFGAYAMKDPTILAIGFGIQTESGLDRSAAADALQHGYVSNGWLLIWRNCGVLGLIGLLLFHIGLYQAVGKKALPPVLVTGLIFLSDNYSIHSPAPFFLIMTFLTVAWAQAITDATRGAPQGSRGNFRRARSVGYTSVTESGRPEEVAHSQNATPPTTTVGSHC